MRSFKQYLENLFIDENVELNAYLRILLEKDKRQSKVDRFFSSYKIRAIKIDKTDIAKIKKQIHKEIDKRAKEDKTRLERVKYKNEKK